MAVYFLQRVRAAGVVALLALATSLPALAQDVAPKATPEAQPQPGPPAGARRQGGDGRPAEIKPASAAPRQLPADSTTAQVLELPGRTLKFKATAGSIALKAGDTRVTAELAYIAYQLDGANPQSRPVAFVFNGGPGSSSAWTHIIGFGPWRLPVDGVSLSPSLAPVLVPNAETWLDFTDLVFIDPVGTGFSQVERPAPGGGGQGGSGQSGGGEGGGGDRSAARQFYSVNGDADSVAQTIETWLRQNGRLASPKLLVGESYSGIRAPKVLARLQTEYGAGISALILISPVMDMALFRGPRHRLSTFVNSLPTIAAAAREAKGQPFKSRDELTEVEAYARGEYLQDLMKGPRDAAALDRIVKRVTAYSGLPEPVVRQYGGKLDEFIYIREANKAARQNASGYDVTVKGTDPDPDSYFKQWKDPFSDALLAPVTSAMIALYEKLGWKTDLPYHLLSGEVNGGWQWGNSSSGVESISQLESALALDPKLRVLVSHGATDLRTPYLGSVQLLEQLPPYADTPAGRVAFKLWPGGHMHYARDASRKALRDDVQKLVADVTAGVK